MVPQLQTISCQLKSLTDTNELACIIAKAISPDFTISLLGGLGAGKTTLVREILRTYGICGSIKSPTFTYVEPYKLSDTNIYHFDLYRFSTAEEWLDMGFEEYFIQPHICFIEWADKAAGLIPGIDWQIELQVSGDIHYCRIAAYTDKGQICLQKLITQGADLFN